MAEQDGIDEGQECVDGPIGLLDIMRNLWLRSLEGNGSRAAQEARAVPGGVVEESQ